MTVYWRCTADEPHYGGGYLPERCPVCIKGEPCDRPCVETDQNGKLRRRRGKVAA